MLSYCGLPFSKLGINQYNNQKTKNMKFVKFSVLALSLGLFVASCGNGGGEAAHTDSAATAAPAEAAPATPAPATTDSAAKPADSAATAAPATAPATEAKH